MGGCILKQMKESMIQFHNVSFAYEDDTVSPVPALQDINLEFHSGEFVAVLGHNGSGKSTLAKLMNAILLPGTGSVTVCGMDTADDAQLNEIRRTVGMVFQNPDNQIVATIVEDDVAFGPENLGVPPAEIRKRVDDALRSVGMYEFREYEPHRLSGGQKQRVAIAGVVAMQTRCIVMDEPTAMLDPRGRGEVLKTVQRLRKDLGVTVIFVTHFMDEAVCADRVIVMEKGSVLLDGTPRVVFANTGLLRQTGLKAPQAARLCQALREDGVPLPEGLLTREESTAEILKAFGIRS